MSDLLSLRLPYARWTSCEKCYTSRFCAGPRLLRAERGTRGKADRSRSFMLKMLRPKKIARVSHVAECHTLGLVGGGKLRAKFDVTDHRISEDDFWHIVTRAKSRAPWQVSSSASSLNALKEGHARSIATESSLAHLRTRCWCVGKHSEVASIRWAFVVVQWLLSERPPALCTQTPTTDSNEGRLLQHNLSTVKPL
jgi:hypothetical protein